MDSETYPTVRIPKTVCPDMKAGQKLSLTIVDVGEDEYEVRYETKKGEKDRAKEVAERYNAKLNETGGDDGGGNV